MLVAVSELLDRLSIVQLKIERIGEPGLEKEKIAIEEALNEYSKKGFVIQPTWLKELYDINGQIWDLEGDIRKGKEGVLGLEEVGRRAIMIRDKNRIRIAIKQRVNEATQTGFKDVKMNHASTDK